VGEEASDIVAEIPVTRQRKRAQIEGENHSGKCYECKSANDVVLTDHRFAGTIHSYCSTCRVPGDCICSLCCERFVKRQKIAPLEDKSEATQSDSVEENTEEGPRPKRHKSNQHSTSKVCAQIYTTIKASFLTEKVNGNKPMEGTANFGRYLAASVGDEIHYIAGRAAYASFRLVMIDRMCCCACALRKYGWEKFGRAAGSFDAALIVYFELFGTPAAEEYRKISVLCDALRWSKKTHDASIRDNCVGFLVWEDCLIESNFFFVQMQHATPEGLSSTTPLWVPPAVRGWSLVNSDVVEVLDAVLIPGTLTRLLDNTEFKPGKVAAVVIGWICIR
jgi:hypothetical protein